MKIDRRIVPSTQRCPRRFGEQVCGSSIDELSPGEFGDDPLPAPVLEARPESWCVRATHPIVPTGYPVAG
ncbi:MAG: hypothetical protein L0K86_00910 [Actinomycetia bacterium]|nr:hypothetical protein [Actinomycetes bacterium]